MKHAGCYIDFFQISLEIYFTDFLMNYNVGLSYDFINVALHMRKCQKIDLRGAAVSTNK